jgi:hypothetical protein
MYHTISTRHEYGNPEQTMQLLKTRSKGMKMNCWQSFYMQVLQQQDLLNDKLMINELLAVILHASSTTTGRADSQ